MVILLVALVFFGSVSCPPIDELESTPDSAPEYPLQADPGTTKPLPGPLQMEDVFGREDLPMEQDYNTFSVSVHAKDGLPLEQASVRVFVTDGSRSSPLVNGATNHDGNLTINWLPDGDYRMEVEHSVYFPAEPFLLEMPSSNELHFDVVLEIGAKLSGELRTATGGAVHHGLVRFRNPEAQREFTVTPDAAGNFDSGPIVAGLWTVDWISHIHADSDPLLRFDAALAPGNHRRLRFTIASSATATTETETTTAPTVVELFE
jgi:5-hydroxyisourate hydrolase-like protein (transthyretin family)